MKESTAFNIEQEQEMPHFIALDENSYESVSYNQPIDITDKIRPANRKGGESVNYDYGKHQELRIVHVIFNDFVKNLFTFFLLGVLTALCLYKIHQVQQTRDITARFNQVITDNENLHKKWLQLTAEKQKLSEHTKIKEQAVDKLKMISPKTDSELVINLYNKK